MTEKELFEQTAKEAMPNFDIEYFKEQNTSLYYVIITAMLRYGSQEFSKAWDSHRQMIDELLNKYKE